MENAAIKTKLLGFGMQLLEGIDPNPDNFVCAAIIHTRSQQIGCLLRLEPNRQAQVSNIYSYVSSWLLYQSPWDWFSGSYIMIYTVYMLGMDTVV